MILIAGATGTNGRMLTTLLAQAGHQVRALVRNPSTAQSLVQPNVELYEGDLAKPGSLEGAFKGVDKAFIVTAITPNTVELFQNFFDAAKRTTKAHIVKFSALGAGYAKSVVQQQHTDSDEALIASGLPYTILRPNSFYQNMLWSAGSIKESGQFYLPFGDAKQSLVDVRDLMAVAAKILTEPGHTGKIYELTGPEGLSYNEIASRLGDVIGKEVTYVPLTSEAYLNGMIESGIPEWTATVLAELYDVFATGEFATTNDNIQKILGKVPNSFDTWANDNKMAFV
ncbi:MAG: SDR family oxidoreductase [Cyanobacteria bacterium J06581_3]